MNRLINEAKEAGNSFFGIVVANRSCIRNCYNSGGTS